jgi:hypothetical protein
MAGLVLGVVAGMAVEGIGKRRAMVAALGAGAVLSAAQALLPPLPVMLALRLAEGVSHLAIVVAAPVLIAGLTPARRLGLAMTLWSSFFAVSFAATVWAGRPLAVAQGLPALFLIHAGLMALLAGVLAMALPRDPPAPRARLTAGALVAGHRAIYASARVAGPATGFFCYTLLYVAILTLLPGMAPPAWGPVLGTGMPLVSIALSLTLGVWALGRLQAARLVQLGFGAGAVAAAGLWLGWGQGAAMTAAALALAGALGIVQGASFASIPQLNASGADRAAAAGAVAQLGNVGTTVGTPLLGWVAAQAGGGGVAGFALLLCLAGVAVQGLQSARRAADRRTAP